MSRCRLNKLLDLILNAAGKRGFKHGLPDRAPARIRGHPRGERSEDKPLRGPDHASRPRLAANSLDDEINPQKSHESGTDPVDHLPGLDPSQARQSSNQEQGGDGARAEGKHKAQA